MPFFARLRDDLDTRGITLVVAYGEPYNTDQRARRDIVGNMSADGYGTVRLPQRSVTLAGRPLVHKRLGGLQHEADVLVVDQSLRNVELYPLLLRQAAGRGPVVAMWDHGRTYTKPQSALEQSLKYALTRRARWFFSYTDGGARAVVDHGFPARRVTVVQNAVDTTALTAARDALTARQITDARAAYGLTPGRTGLFVGALSPAKRIGFLTNAAERIGRRLPGFKLLVAGAGEDEQRLHEAASPVVVPVGRADDARKALLGAVSDVLLMPGLVGLCAVDSFALRTPIVTTRWLWHAPEFEYLTDGRNAVVTADDE
ncbi:MAG: glycosyltransferase family 4 protein, partial [Streptomycetaceae bacterium]|nr:glycosyltransferase family 4 protein [Streptomycetaceae bacterium]